jgi:predicted dehydrogenase
MKLPVALIGAGARSSGVYVPALTGPLADRFQIVGVIARTDFRAPALADALGVPWSLDVEAAVGWGARGLILCASAHNNGAVARSALELNLPLLLETPLALDLEEARAVAHAASSTVVEVAEQNPRFPEVQLWRRVIEEGWIGRVRAVASDAAGYRYHAAAVARSLLGRPRAAHAMAVRTVFGHDFGRGMGPEPLYAGAITTEGGAIYQVRDGEPVHTGAWQRGGWWVAGDEGSLTTTGVSRGGELTPFVKDSRDGLTVWRCGELEVAPEEAGDDDQVAVCRCLSDWLERIEGRVSPTAWSVIDAFSDLAWTVAIERSATLGVRIEVPQLERGGA